LKAWLGIAVVGVCLGLAGCRQAPEGRPASGPRRPVVLPVSATAPVPTPSVQDVVAALDTARMTAHIVQLAGAIGPRHAGTAAERAGADYLAAQLAASGYTVSRRTVPLPTGGVTCNVLAELPGTSARTLLICAHLDSRGVSPGANDNASGVAVVLELARVLRHTRPAYTLLFVGCGAEERLGRRGPHHLGSRALAADAALRARLAGAISLDMVGYGTILHIDNQGWAADTWRDRAARIAADLQLPVATGRSKPVSDHEAFERLGIPAAYLHWGRDPAYHTRADRPARIQPLRLRQTAEVMVRLLLQAKPETQPPADL